MSRKITIDPFEPSDLGLAHYRLHPSRIYTLTQSAGVVRPQCVYDRVHNGGTFSLDPHLYVLVEIRERVVLPDGMFGRLVATSRMIERGLSLESGKLDAGYGDLLGERAPLFVALRNNLTSEVTLSVDDAVAHLEIVDLRGTEPRFGGFSDESLEQFALRSRRFMRARDDGVVYE